MTTGQLHKKGLQFSVSGNYRSKTYSVTYLFYCSIRKPLKFSYSCGNMTKTDVVDLVLYQRKAFLPTEKMSLFENDILNFLQLLVLVCVILRWTQFLTEILIHSAYAYTLAEAWLGYTHTCG